MRFPTTQWSLLAVATLNGDASADRALGEFYLAYRRPVIAFIRDRGFAAAEADDLAQEFMLHLMGKSTLRHADAARGRFRSFLLGALVRFLRDVRKRRARLKRGGGIAPLSLDHARLREADLPAASQDTTAFDYQWAVDLLERARRELETHYSRRGRGMMFAVLRAFLPGGLTPPSYAEAAARLSMPVSRCKTEVHRLRARFRDHLRHEIAATVASPDEISEEISYLSRVLQQRGRGDAPAGNVA